MRRALCVRVGRARRRGARCEQGDEERDSAARGTGKDRNHEGYQLDFKTFGRQYTGADITTQRFAMWVIFLEAGLALCLLLIMVWATWPRRRDQPAPPDAKDDNKHDD